MLPPSQSADRLVFGPFEVNIRTGQLLKSGVRIRLSGQPLQILLIVLAQSGEVVTSEQLREQIWKEGTFVDFEHGLHAAVNKLRRCLGDSADNPRYVETVPGRGYRFIGVVERHRAAIPFEAGSLGPSPVSPQSEVELSLAWFRPNRRLWMTAAATLLFGALGGWAVSHIRRTPTDERVLNLQIN